MGYLVHVGSNWFNLVLLRKQTFTCSFFPYFCMEKQINMKQKQQENFVDLLKQAIERKIGRTLRTPADFDFLILKMEEEGADTLSLSTLKRIWNYVPASCSTRFSTLSVLARFLGFYDFSDFCRSIEIESDFLTNMEVRSCDLRINDMVKISWFPDRMCSLRYLGNNRFIVVESQNAKLLPGDTFSTLVFRLKHPLYATELYRSGYNMHSYVAALRHGLSEIICTRS